MQCFCDLILLYFLFLRYGKKAENVVQLKNYSYLCAIIKNKYRNYGKKSNRIDPCIDCITGS